MPEQLTTAVKIVKETDEYITVGGWGVVYGGRDLQGEMFTRETDFMLDLAPAKLVLYDHRATGVKNTLGKVHNADIEARADGLWIQAQLERSKDYVNEVRELVAAGVLGWSSGSVGHLVDRQGPVIKSWPIVEFSLTPTPAEPRTLGVELIKSLAADNPSLQAFLPEAAQDTAEQDATATGNAVSKSTIEILETKQMSDEKTPEVDAPEYVTKTQYANTQKTLDTIMGILENAPALKQAGYVAPDSETDHPQVKSFGDFLLAVKYGNTKRLATVYKSHSDATKDISSQSGAAGGFLIPDEFVPRLMQIQAQQSQIISRVTRQQVGSDHGGFPSLNQFVTPTAGSGQTALAAGVTATNTSPGAAYAETQPTFKDLNYQIRKEGGYVEVENEVVADSPVVIESLLSNLFAITVNNKIERHILRGSGAGEPEGILNAACAIGITPDTNNLFAWADSTEMVSRFKQIGAEPVWLIHSSIWPDIGNFETTGGGGVFQANMAGRLGQTLLGHQILTSEHLPQANNSGCVILADLSAYIMFERQGLSVAFSEHAAFTSGKGTWRFDARIDGMPWLTSPVIGADPQGSFTVSPFVYLND